MCQEAQEEAPESSTATEASACFQAGRPEEAQEGQSQEGEDARVPGEGLGPQGGEDQTEEGQRGEEKGQDRQETQLGLTCCNVIQRRIK